MICHKYSSIDNQSHNGTPVAFSNAHGKFSTRTATRLFLSQKVEISLHLFTSSTPCNLCVTSFTLESLTLHHIHIFKLEFISAMRDQAQLRDRMNPRDQELFDYLKKKKKNRDSYSTHALHQPKIIDTTIPKHINHNDFEKARMYDAASIGTGTSTRTGKTAVTSATSSSHKEEDVHDPLPDVVLQSLSESLSVEHPPSEAMNPMTNETCTLPKKPVVKGSNNSGFASELARPEHQYPQEDMDRTLLEQSKVQPSVPSMLHKLGVFFKNPISCGDEAVSPSQNECVNGNAVKSHANMSSSSNRTSKSADESKERIAILEASLAEKTREIERFTKLQELVVIEVSILWKAASILFLGIISFDHVLTFYTLLPILE